MRATRPIDYQGEGNEFEAAYRIEDDDLGSALWRRRDPVPDDVPDGGGVAEPIADGIVAMTIEASEGDGGWTTDWDSDTDGMPDIFEQYYGLAPNRNSVPENPRLEPGGDIDEDGLNNLYEYLSGNDPRDTDTDQDGVSDADEDPDADGLTNLDEQRLGKAWHAGDQAVAAAKQRHQHLVDHFVLADDHLAQFRQDLVAAAGDLFGEPFGHNSLVHHQCVRE